MKNRNLLTALLALALFLAACAPAGGQEPLPDTLDNVPSFEQEIDPSKEVLIYAKTSSPYDTDAISQSAIDKFNRTHDDVQIVVRDYCSPEYGTGGLGEDLLRTELAAGQLPDIIDLSILPYRHLARKEYLEDLWPYIENDPDLGRDSVIDAPLKAAEVDGKLCMLFGAVEIETLVGAVDRVGARTGWTLAELQDAFASMPAGSTILSFDTCRGQLFNFLTKLSLASYVDWETGTCSFDSPSFRSLLEFARLFPSDEEVAVETAGYGSSIEVYEERRERLRKGLQMLDESTVAVSNLSILEALHGGHCAFVGYPTEDGSTGSMFRPRGAQLGISSTCRNKEAAWEFIRTMLTDLPSYSDNCIPIKQDLYDSRKTTAMLVETTIGKTPDGEEIKAPPVTEDQVQRFENFFNSIDKIDIWDRSLFFLVKEAAGPYFAGDKTLDETVDLIQRRVTLYVNESR